MLKGVIVDEYKCVRECLYVGLCMVMKEVKNNHAQKKEKKGRRGEKDLCDFKEFFKDSDDNHDVSSNNKKRKPYKKDMCKQSKQTNKPSDIVCVCVYYYSDVIWDWGEGG